MTTPMKILFCSDGSTQSDNAVRFWRVDRRRRCQAETSILGIVEKVGREDAVLQALRRGQEILKEYHLNAELITKAALAPSPKSSSARGKPNTISSSYSSAARKARPRPVVHVRSRLQNH